MDCLILTVITNHSFHQYTKKIITDNILRFETKMAKSLRKYNNWTPLSLLHQLNYLQQQMFPLELEFNKE